VKRETTMGDEAENAGNHGDSQAPPASQMRFDFDE
jgi:hypothetical protein